MVNYKMISLFKFIKFKFLCNNEKEWNIIQEHLFKLGYEWEVHGKNILKTSWRYPLIIQNSRSQDKFGSKFLIMDSYNFFRYTNPPEKKIISVTAYFRKEKLKKINDKKN